MSQLIDKSTLTPEESKELEEYFHSIPITEKGLEEAYKRLSKRKLEQYPTKSD